MKGVDRGGGEVVVDLSEGTPAKGVLRDLSVATLRAFLVNLMKKGGVPPLRQAKVMRCSKMTLRRDLEALERSP